MKLTLSNYKLNDLIYESSHSLIYRALQEADQRPVILKVLREEYSSPGTIARFKHEYEILCSLNLSGVVKAYGQKRYRHHWVLAMEDFGGTSLSKLALMGKFPLDEFLTIAIDIADILGQVHHYHIMHKDINPSNIVFNPATGQMKLIDFGISTVLSREIPTFQSPATMEGTLAYISPEQTGRMNRAVDYRTDLYSLGVTLYELLTGQVPFLTADALELFHCHIAKQPAPPTALKPDIPRPVSDIVMKLLNKDAEDRYQSAQGLKRDLEECMKQWLSSRDIKFFSLGRHDVSIRFQIPHKLYGRSHEIQTLLSSFERGAAGSREVLVVSGYSGIGKSALVHEIYKPITPLSGCFIEGKFDQLKRNVPYSAIVDAFRNLIQQFLTESEAQLAAWREKFLKAFGPNGRIIIDVIPEIELIIGPQPPVQELGPTEAQNRFDMTFLNFIRVLGQPEHPLAIFLDDMQWTDIASLRFIELVMLDSDIHHVFLMCAYRDNEVDSMHPWMSTVEALHKGGVIVNHITLEPLKLEYIMHLIADTIHRDLTSVKPLAELVFEKTGGNPFFVNEFLKILYQEGLFSFNYILAQWQWDLEQIRTRNITNNVVELMIQRIRKLPEQTQHLLQLAASIGNTFSLKTLSIIYEKSLKDTSRDLFVVLQEGLIVSVTPLEVAHDRDSDTVPLSLNYKFLHDRVQQAAYVLIPHDQKKQLHYRIGRLLLASLLPKEREERIFEVVSHLNLGRELILNSEEKIALARLNLEAGKKAKEATAYASAVDYLAIGIGCMADNSWKEHYEDMFALLRERAEAAYLKGDFTQAEADFAEVLKNTKDKYDTAEIHLIRITQLVQLGKYHEAMELGLKSLKLFEYELPDVSTSEKVQQAMMAGLEEYRRSVGGRKVADLVHLPEVVERDKRYVLRILANLIDCSYIAQPLIFPQIIIATVNFSMKYGYSDVSALGFVSLAGLLILAMKDYRGAHEIGKLGLALNERFSNIRFKARILMAYAVFTTHWTDHLSVQVQQYQNAFQIAIDTGDLVFAGYGRSLLPKTILGAGEHIDRVIEENEKSIMFLRQTASPFAGSERFFNMFLLNLRGDRADTWPKWSFDSDEISESKILEEWQNASFGHGLAFYLSYKVQNLFFFERYREAWELASTRFNWIQSIATFFEETVFYYFWLLSALALYESATPEEKTTYWDFIERKQKEIKLWAETCPVNYQCKYLLINAEIARILGKNWEAAELYDQSIHAASQSEFIQNEALAYELAAKFWLSRGKRDISRLYMIRAYHAYLMWGAKAKADDIYVKYGELIAHPHKPASVAVTASYPIAATRQSAADNLDLMSIIKASQTLFSEMVLERLLINLMRIVMENAGARRGFFIMEKDGNLLIEAECVENKEATSVFQSVHLEHRPLSAAIVKYVARTRQSVVLHAATQEGLFTKDPYIQEYRPKSILCMPILRHDRSMGILYLENNLTTGGFSQERLRLLNIISSQAAISIENARLYTDLEQKVAERTAQLKLALAELGKLATTDKLTGAHNRRKFDEILSLEMSRARRIDQPLSMIIFDVDHFKRINDTFGHQAGDEVLKMLVGTVREKLRVLDVLARWGGEEFIVLTTSTDLEGAIILAERVRAVVEEQCFSFAVHITISLGVAEYKQDDTADSFIQRADSALYRAKRNGRNRVEAE